MLPQQKNTFPCNFFTWFTIVWIVHEGKLFRFLFTSGHGSPWSSCSSFCPWHCPLCLFLEGRSAAPVAAVEPQVTAQCGKVKPFQFQVTFLPRAADCGARCANSWALLQQDRQSKRDRQAARQETITAGPKWASCSEIWAVRACLQPKLHQLL